MLRFSSYALTRVILYLTFKKTKIYKNVGVATKAPPCFNLAQNSHFIQNDSLISMKLLEMYSLTSNRYITATKSIKYDVKYLTQIVIFRHPLSDLVFWAALSHFLADFNIIFLLTFPPISIPFLKEKYPVLTKLGAFYNNLPKIHPIYVIWAPSSLMKSPNCYTKFREKAPQKAGTYTCTRNPPVQN